MSNSAPPSEPRDRLTTGIRPIPSAAIRANRAMVAEGFSRRTLLRRGLGTVLGLWVVEVLAGTVAYAWTALGGGASGIVRIGTFHEFLTLGGSLPVGEGFPVYVAEARSFVVLVDPERGGWFAGEDETGDGRALNVRALYQRCPHLGCKPEPVPGGLLDPLSLPPVALRPPRDQDRRRALRPRAARSMDRFAIRVDGDGVLFVDNRKITLGPLPVALGMPGVIPPLVEDGCA